MPSNPASFIDRYLPRKLSDKVLAMCIVVTLSQVLTAGALYLFSERSAAADRVVVESKVAQIHLERMNRLILAVVMDSRGMYAQSTYAAAEPFAKTMLKSMNELEAMTAKTRASIPQEGLAAFDVAAKKLGEFLVFRHEFLKVCRESWMPACKDFSDNDVNRKSRQALNAAIDEVGSQLDAYAVAAEATMEIWRTRMRALMAFAIVGALGGMAFVLWLIVTHVKRPFGGMTMSVRALARGDLSADIYGAGRTDEIGEIAHALAVFRDELRQAESGRAQSEAERAEADKRRLEAQAQRAAAEERQLRSERERAAATEEAVRHERQIVSTSFGGVIASLSQKDLQRRMTDALPEAYAMLQKDFNSAIDAIEAAIAAVVVSARALASGSEEIAGASNDLSRRTEHQASNLEEIAATFLAMNEKVAQTAQGALVARDAVASASATAREGEDIARATIAAMQKIEKSSTQISAILSLINEISFQTNLLALNAGVEAARAGEAGRGFSVVATEVRALAVRSATAAREIEALIAQASAEVAEGGKLVLRSGEAFVAIQAAIDNGREIVAKIADRAQEQSTGLREINGALQQLETMTQQNAAMAEQATAASRSLSSEAVKLARLTGDFKTGMRGQPRRGAQGADERAA